jgi:hypothetical protein
MDFESNNIAPAVVKKIIEGKGYYILSVHTAEDFAKGHIEMTHKQNGTCIRVCVFLPFTLDKCVR